MAKSNYCCDEVTKIVGRLDDKNSNIRKESIRKLVKMGIAENYIVMKIAEKLDDRDKDVQLASLYALGNLGVKSENIILKIIEKIEDSDPAIRDRAVWTISRLGVKDKKIILRISEKLKSNDLRVREAVLELLSKLEIRSGRVVKKVVNALNDKIPRVRENALWTLFEWGKRDKKLFKKILNASGLAPRCKFELNNKLLKSRFRHRIFWHARWPLNSALQNLDANECQQNIAWFIKVWKINNSLASPNKFFQVILQMIGILGVLGISLGSIFYKRLAILGLLLLLLIVGIVAYEARSFVTEGCKEWLKLSWASFWYYMNKRLSFEWVFKKLLKSPKSK